MLFRGWFKDFPFAKMRLLNNGSVGELWLIRRSKGIVIREGKSAWCSADLPMEALIGADENSGSYHGPS